MTIKEKIDFDLKEAMLAGDKLRVSILRGLKSVILYAELPTSGQKLVLSDEEVINLLQKEAKKRQESADLYQKGGSDDKAQSELNEREIIMGYLPEEMSIENLHALVVTVIDELGSDKQNMGQIIAEVRRRADGIVDGAILAGIVKEKLI